MRLFLDSSALAKRYIREPGSDEVTEACSRAKKILLSILCIPESISAFKRLKREHTISAKTYQDLKTKLNGDVNQASIVPLDYVVLRRTIACLEKTQARTLDAIQIASALEARCQLFLSADVKQCTAARLMGLKTRLV